MAGPNRRLGRPAVLVVEDEDRLRILTVSALRRAAFRVVEARDAAQALRVLRAAAPRVGALFTDIHMPGGMTGLELAREARRTWPWIGVLVTSFHGLPDRDGLPESERFLPKPYRMEDVVRCLREIGL